MPFPRIAEQSEAIQSKAKHFAEIAQSIEH